MRFKVTGADRITGDEREEMVEAPSREQAETIAGSRGMWVSGIQNADEPIEIEYASPRRKRRIIPPPRGYDSFARLVGIIFIVIGLALIPFNLYEARSRFTDRALHDLIEGQNNTNKALFDIRDGIDDTRSTIIVIAWIFAGIYLMTRPTP